MPEGRAANAAVIGGRLRDLRAARELSLRQLAKLIGASPSLLSQIENGKVTPSVDTLYLLAAALAVPVAAFFGDPAPAQTGPSGAWVVRAMDRQRISLEGGITWENLLPREEAGLRFMEIRYAPGANSGEHMLRHAGRDLFVVLEGEIVFRIGFGEHRLHAGDSISFADYEPHQLRNDGKIEARAIVCVVGDYEGSRPPEGS
jgi:transcriptional regulator with XRE-family HTH domain